MIIKNWNQLLNTECVVIKIQDQLIYPIFRNASTNLIRVSDKTYVDEDIQFDLITVFIRDPIERFTSAVNTYCWINGLDVRDTEKKIHAGVLVDRHFVPQWVWLLHLYKYHKKQVLLRPISAVREVCDIRNQKIETVSVTAPRKFIESDQKIMQHINEQVDLEFLVKEYKVVLS